MVRWITYLLLLFSPLTALAGEEINVYSARQEHLIRPLLDDFTAKSGITVNLLTGDADQLLARLRSEQAATPADVLLTSDVGRLLAAKAEGMLQPLASPVLDANIPLALRDPEHMWFGLTLRARVIFYAKDRVKPSELSTYEALAEPVWRKRLCIRSSGNVYNQSLLAALILNVGAQNAEAWASGIVANMARRPQGGDRDQIRAVAAGQCDVALANTYYYGGLLTSSDPADRAAAAAVGLYWPDQQGRGAHVNISGAGVLRHAPHPAAARAFLEYLSGAEAQGLYAALNHEHPVHPGTATSPLLDSWGAFKSDPLPLWRLGQESKNALRMFDRVGWR